MLDRAKQLAQASTQSSKAQASPPSSSPPPSSNTTNTQPHTSSSIASSIDSKPATTPSTSFSPARSWADTIASSDQKLKKANKSPSIPKSAPVASPTSPSFKEQAPQSAPTYTLPSVAKKLPLGQTLVNYKGSTPTDQFPPIYSRGIINTGNICFMNSILQALIHCVPFLQLLDYISKNALHSIQSDTPLLDALIEFRGEFSQAPPSSNGSSDAELTSHSTSGGLINVNPHPLSPESFYSKLRVLPRFSHLKRGRQEDAEEFLGYLLEGLHDEFARVMKPFGGDSQSFGDAPVEDEDEWQEVGKNNKALQVRQAAGFGQTPITLLFGGQFKSILNVAKVKSPSITRDPFQHVQLDISDPDVHSIEDAFMHLAHLEELQYTTSTRQEVKATKQILMDAVPRILIIHLKRFSYMSNGGVGGGVGGLGGSGGSGGGIYDSEVVQKISKPISFPEQLKIPREALSRTLANATGGPPSFTLCAVVYHHGRSAGSGHYTVDVRTPDKSSEQWINVDDTSVTKTGVPLSPSNSPGVVPNGGSSSGNVWGSTGSNSAAYSSPLSSSSSSSMFQESSKTAYILFYVQNPR